MFNLATLSTYYTYVSSFAEDKSGTRLYIVQKEKKTR